MRKRILSIVVLIAATAIFTLIGSLFLLNPVSVAAENGIALRNALAITTMRIAGVFPLSIALVTLAGLISSRFRVAAVQFACVVFFLSLAVRVVSVFIDRSEGNGPLIFVEAFWASLALVALVIEKSAVRGTPPASLPQAS